jgi:hypothetical protein
MQRGTKLFHPIFLNFNKQVKLAINTIKYDTIIIKNRAPNKTESAKLGESVGSKININRINKEKIIENLNLNLISSNIICLFINKKPHQN